MQWLNLYQKKFLFKDSSKNASNFRTCAHHWIGNNIDCVPNVENFEVFKFFCLVSPHNIHLSQSLVNAAGETFVKSWNLTVSDFCNSSSSSGRKQRVELAGPSHSGRDISSILKENFVLGLKTLKVKFTQSFAFLALNIGIICKSYAHLNKQSLGHRKKCQIHWALNFNIHRVPKYQTKNYWNQQDIIVGVINFNKALFKVWFLFKFWPTNI